MRFTLTTLFSLVFLISFGQNFKYPTIIKSGKQAIDFIPKGWTILDSAQGDLNKDGLADKAIILQTQNKYTLENDEQEQVETQPRILVILFKDPLQNGYKVVCQSNSFIPKEDHPNMDEVYQTISVEKGILNIKLQQFYTIGSWYLTNISYKFRFQNNSFALIGADHYSMHRASLDFEEHSYNFLTRKRVVTKGNANKAAKKSSSSTITFTELKTLDSLKKAFDWAVEEDVYL